MFCTDIITTSLFIFSEETPALLYYSHLPTAIIALFLGLFIFLNNRKDIANKIFFILNILYGLLIFLNLVLWTNSHIPTLTFIWPLTQILFIVIPIFSLYFFYVFINKKDIGILYKIILSGLITISIILAYSKLNIVGFNPDLCEVETTNFLFIYQNIIFILVFISLVISYTKKMLLKTLEIDDRKILTLSFLGILIFLILFIVTWQIAEAFDYFNLEQYGLFGMTIFLSIMSFLIVKFKTFHIKLIATQALVWGLVALIGSQFFFIKVTTNFILNGITFVGIIILGQFLVKSVKKEVMQREQLQILTEELFKANEKLKSLDQLKTEFLSLASHQLRSPLTAIKGYTSMLLEGDYGKIDPKAKETIERVFESTNNLTIVVEDLLNVAKIEQGGMKYEMASFNLSDVARKEAEDLSVTAEKKGLKLSFEETGGDDCMTVGDKDKLRQVVLNFIDNSIKYTKEGEIKVKVEKKREKVVFSVKDTGMGMTEETKETLFQKFARGEGGRVNSGGSGLGLYLAKEIAEAHKGRVWVESEGMGKGSTFFMELDAIK